MKNQLKQSFIKRLKAKNIPVTWDFLLLGFIGPGVLPAQLSADEIVDYALQTIMEGSTNNLVEYIAYSEVGELQFIESKLRILSAQESEKSKADDFKKWELLLLEDLLQNLPEDSITGLTELTSFWSQLDFPSESPHKIQGRNNSLTPEDYYTKENYQQLIKKHIQWMQQTEQRLSRKK